MDSLLRPQSHIANAGAVDRVEYGIHPAVSQLFIEENFNQYTLAS